MRAFAVRLIENREVVGFFFAPSLAELYCIVDECCDPGETEYSTLPPGGIIWERGGAAKMPMCDGVVDMPEDGGAAEVAWEKKLFNGASLSEVWMNKIGFGEAKWKPLVPDLATLERYMNYFCAGKITRNEKTETDDKAAA